MFTYVTTTSDRAIAHQLVRGDQTQIFAVETEMLEHPEIGSDVDGLLNSLADTGSNLAKIAADLSETGLSKEAASRIDRSVTPKFRLAVEAQRRATSNLEGEEALLYTPRFPENSEPAIRAEQRGWWRGLSMSAKLEAATADPILAAAIVETGPAMSILPADVFSRLRRGMAEAQLADRILLNNAMRSAPTADDPVGGRPDRATALANAADRLDRLDAERELLNRVPAVLADVVSAAALMAGETRQATFQRLSA